MKNVEFCRVLEKYQDQAIEKHEGLADQTINELSGIATNIYGV